MVFLHSIHSGPESIRSSFCGPIHLEDSTFAMSVDEPPGGPVVIRVAGDIDETTVSVFGECVSEAIVCGRSLVVDLLDVGSIDQSGVAILRAASARLSANRCRLIVACSREVQQALEKAWTGAAIECYGTVAASIGAALRPRHDAPMAVR